MSTPKAAGRRFAAPSRCGVGLHRISNRSTISFGRAGLCSQPFTCLDAAGNLPEALDALLTPSLHLSNHIVLDVGEQDKDPAAEQGHIHETLLAPAVRMRAYQSVLKAYKFAVPLVSLEGLLGLRGAALAGWLSQQHAVLDAEALDVDACKKAFLQA